MPINLKIQVNDGYLEKYKLSTLTQIEMQNLYKPIIIKALEMKVYTLLHSKILYQKKKIHQDHFISGLY